jgi:hypothetical protein
MLNTDYIDKNVQHLYFSKCFYHSVIEGWFRSLLFILWKIRKHGSIHKSTLHFKHGNFLVILVFVTEHTWHPETWSCTLPFSSVLSFKTTLLVFLGLIEVEAPLHSFPTSFELKSHKVFGGLFGYHILLEWYNYLILLDTTGWKIMSLFTVVFSN